MMKIRAEFYKSEEEGIIQNIKGDDLVLNPLHDN